MVFNKKRKDPYPCLRAVPTGSATKTMQDTLRRARAPFTLIIAGPPDDKLMTHALKTAHCTALIQCGAHKAPYNDPRYHHVRDWETCADAVKESDPAQSSYMLARDIGSLQSLIAFLSATPLHKSLDGLALSVPQSSLCDQALEDGIADLRLLGLALTHKALKGKTLSLFFKRPDHYKTVEHAREHLGAYGQTPDAPRYSVCVCNYNMADTLERALGSVLKQLDPARFEVVVIDDGSTDDSLQALSKLQQTYSHLRYFSLPRDPKRRLGETRNISIRAARGEYVLLHIDADDEWEPFLQDFVTLYHKIEAAAQRDIHLSGQQTGIGKRDMLLRFGPYDNHYRCEDRNLMMKLAKKNLLLFMDYRVYRTRMTRPVKKKIIKTIWDDCSQMSYDLRQNEAEWFFIKHALTMPFTGRKFSLISKLIRPVLILPMYVITRFMPPIINHISRAEMRIYHAENRGTYSELMTRFGADPDISFLSKPSQDIYSYAVKLPGIRSAR